jgi:hypothetical protein
VTLDSKQQSGTIQFGASMPEVSGALPVQRINCATGR